MASRRWAQIVPPHPPQWPGACQAVRGLGRSRPKAKPHFRGDGTDLLACRSSSVASGTTTGKPGDSGGPRPSPLSNQTKSVALRNPRLPNPRQDTHAAAFSHVWGSCQANASDLSRRCVLTLWKASGGAPINRKFEPAPFRCVTESSGFSLPPAICHRAAAHTRDSENSDSCAVFSSVLHPGCEFDGGWWPLWTLGTRCASCVRECAPGDGTGGSKAHIYKRWRRPRRSDPDPWGRPERPILLKSTQKASHQATSIGELGSRCIAAAALLGGPAAASGQPRVLGCVTWAGERGTKRHEQTRPVGLVGGSPNWFPFLKIWTYGSKNKHNSGVLKY